MPEMLVHFDVSRERSIAAIQQAMVEEQEIFLVAQKSIETENPGQDDVYETGTVASVKQLIKLSKKVVRVLVEGKNRAVLKKIEETDPYLRAEVEVLEEQEITIPDDLNAEAMMRGLKEIITEYAAKNPIIICHRTSVGTVKLRDLALEQARRAEYQADMLVAKYAMGHGGLRPEASFIGVINPSA